MQFHIVIIFSGFKAADISNTDLCLFPVAPPSPPTPKVSDWTRSTVDLEWIPPLKDGGSKIIGYWVEFKEEGTEAWVKVLAHESYKIKAL